MHKISCYRLSEGSITISLLFLFFSTTEPRGFIFFTSIHQKKEYFTFLSDIQADNVSVEVCVCVSVFSCRVDFDVRGCILLR